MKYLLGPETSLAREGDPDVATLDGIMAAFYDVICGPADQPRDWDRDRKLYAPQCVLVATGLKDGKPYTLAMDIDGYRERTEPIFKATGFYEYETERMTKSFGNVTHVFSRYEGKHTPDGPIVVSGVNSIQLVYTGNRWWIASVAWDNTAK